MSISGRVPLLLLLGVGAILLRPEMSTMWLWVLAVLLLICVDLLLAPPPGALALERPSVGSVRLGDPTATTLLATSSSSRRLHGIVRDAWQPTAGATENRHRITL